MAGHELLLLPGPKSLLYSSKHLIIPHLAVIILPDLASRISPDLPWSQTK